MRQPADHAAAERVALQAAFATGRPFTGLRGHRHDPALDSAVPPALARRLRIVPLALEDGVLRVASADPQADAAALSARLGGRPVAVTLAPATEIDDLLGPARPARPWLLAALAAAVAVAVAIVLLATTGDGSPPAERAGKATPAVVDTAQSAPQPPPRPLTVAVTGNLPRALRDAWPSDTAAHPASSRADALAALCTGSADVAVLDTPPSGAERADAGCALATAAEVTVQATVLRAPRGGCVRPGYAWGVVRRRHRRPDGRVRDVAVRDDRDRCIGPTPDAIGSGAYPLTRRVALVTGPAGAPDALPSADRIRPRVTTVVVRRLR